MIPACDHVGVPGLVGFTHLSSSTTSGSATLISARILVSISPRQSPSPEILAEICFDAAGSCFAGGFFIVSPSFRHSRLNPTTKHFNLVLRPRAVARHGSVLQPTQDLFRVFHDIAVCPQVEDEPHR